MPAPRKAFVHKSERNEKPSERKQREATLKLRRIRKAFAERMLPAVERMLEASRELQQMRRSMHRKCARVGGARCIDEFDMAFDETIEEQNDREAYEIMGIGFEDVVKLGRDLKEEMGGLKAAAVAPELPSETNDKVRPKEAEDDTFDAVSECSTNPDEDGGSCGET